jgi:two-component system chemotaxis response regulator CheB
LNELWEIENLLMENVPGPNSPSIEELPDESSALSIQTCPTCGGRLSEISCHEPIEFRCDFGHTFTTTTLVGEQSSKTSQSIWKALRALREKHMLLTRLADDARASNLPEMAEQYESDANGALIQSDLLNQLISKLDTKQAIPLLPVVSVRQVIFSCA